MSKVKTNSIGNVAGTVTMTVQELRDLLDAPSDAVGVDQTWQNMAGSRTTGVTYTNDTGRPIMVAHTISASLGSDLLVDGVKLFDVIDSGGKSELSYIVPAGSTYRMNAGTVVTWAELR